MDQRVGSLPGLWPVTYSPSLPNYSGGTARDFTPVFLIKPRPRTGCLCSYYRRSMANMSRKTNISRAGYECVTRAGYERVTRYNLTNDPCTRPTLYYKVANVLIQSPDFQLNTTIMVVKCWRRHMFAPSFGYHDMVNDGALFMQIYA